LRAVEGATALNRNAYARQMLEQIDSAKQALHGEYQRLATQYGNVQSLLAYYQGLVEQIKGRRYLTAERAHTAPATQP
jgi:conjugative transfer pilus assembly protein TraH